jgi:hypothetical protein
VELQDVLRQKLAFIKAVLKQNAHGWLETITFGSEA